MTKKHPTSSLLYYIGRISHRLLLCMVVATTIVYWIVLIFSVCLVDFIHFSPNAKPTDPAAASHELSMFINLVSQPVLKWAVVLSAVTLILLCIKRFRTYDKPMLVDGIVIAAFCLISVAFGAPIVRAFLTGIVR